MSPRSNNNCLVLLAIFACAAGVAQARIDDICSLFSDGTIIRDPESCSRYIKCEDFKSTYTTCPRTTPYFDKDKQTCVKSLDAADDCNLSCVGASRQFIADPKSCFGYYYCEDEETPVYGTCALGTHFNVTTQECFWASMSECKTSAFDYCSIIKNDVNFDNVAGCNRYHVCKKGKLEDKACSSKYYRASTGECVAKTLVPCAAHPYPSNVCGTTKSPKKNYKAKDGATCQGYFYCTETADGSPDPSPFWAKCPTDKFFDEKSQSCKEPNSVVCNEDRCQGRTLPFVLSSQTGCRHYLRCKDNRIMDERSCGNYFFDEANGVCVNQILKYAIC
ncbi:CG17145 [Drosophila busckii]|uniref:CG17145 n=1 Tax=Drosophila busckii TaxID=30019 RepID=A0A0M4E7T9_DROBS|nr:peritrophin-44 [Drosophila busckii]ALC37964.1 CG17145 [Drosophila busckii]